MKDRRGARSRASRKSCGEPLSRDGSRSSRRTPPIEGEPRPASSSRPASEDSSGTSDGARDQRARGPGRTQRRGEDDSRADACSAARAYASSPLSRETGSSCQRRRRARRSSSAASRVCTPVEPVSDPHAEDSEGAVDPGEDVEDSGDFKSGQHLDPPQYRQEQQHEEDYNQDLDQRHRASVGRPHRARQGSRAHRAR